MTSSLWQSIGFLLVRDHSCGTKWNRPALVTCYIILCTIESVPECVEKRSSFDRIIFNSGGWSQCTQSRQTQRLRQSRMLSPRLYYCCKLWIKHLVIKINPFLSLVENVNLVSVTDSIASSKLRCWIICYPVYNIDTCTARKADFME